MKQTYFLDNKKLHQSLREELPTAVETTELIAKIYFPMLSEKFDNLEDFELHLQGQLYEPLSGLTFWLSQTDHVPEKSDVKHMIQTTVSNYLRSYIENELTGFKLKPQIADDEILVLGYKLKIWICEHGTLRVRFKGSLKSIKAFASETGAIYKPITDAERMYGISFVDGGIS